MTRKEFFNLIQNELLYPVYENDFTGYLQFQINEEDSKELYKTYTMSNQEVFERTGFSKDTFLKKQFLDSRPVSKFLSKYDLNPNMSDLQSLPIKIEINAYFEEDGFLFNGEINANEIYDRLNLSLGKLKLYRLELSSGSGAYSGSMKIHSECDQRNPAPESDGDIRTIFCPKRSGPHGNSYYRDWIFAFDSKESLFNWFHDEKDIKNFLDKDIVITEYEADNQFIVSGKTQVAFMRSKGVKIKSIPYKDLASEHKLHLERNNIVELLMQKKSRSTTRVRPRRGY